MKTQIILLISSLCILSLSSFGQETKLATIKEIDTIKVFNGATFDVYSLKKLTPKKVVVSSTLPHKNNIYRKENLLDNDQSTAWVEGRDGDGKGDKITFFFKGPSTS